VLILLFRSLISGPDGGIGRPACRQAGALAETAQPMIIALKQDFCSKVKSDSAIVSWIECSLYM
jgi:hypothetical protein